MPLAFFGTFFRSERKYYSPRGGSPIIRAGVGAPPLAENFLRKSWRMSVQTDDFPQYKHWPSHTAAYSSFEFIPL